MLTIPADIIGDLQPGKAVGVHPCIPANELREDDVLFAAGFPRGDRRRVLEVRLITGVLYVRVVEGWFRWTRVYANVAEY